MLLTEKPKEVKLLIEVLTDVDKIKLFEKKIKQEKENKKCK